MLNSFVYTFLSSEDVDKLYSDKRLYNESGFMCYRGLESKLNLPIRRALFSIHCTQPITKHNSCVARLRLPEVHDLLTLETYRGQSYRSSLLFGIIRLNELKCEWLASAHDTLWDISDFCTSENITDELLSSVYLPSLFTSTKISYLVRSPLELNESRAKVVNDFKHRFSSDDPIPNYVYSDYNDFFNRELLYIADPQLEFVGGTAL